MNNKEKLLCAAGIYVAGVAVGVIPFADKLGWFVKSASHTPLGGGLVFKAGLETGKWGRRIFLQIP